MTEKKQRLLLSRILGNGSEQLLTSMNLPITLRIETRVGDRQWRRTLVVEADGAIYHEGKQLLPPPKEPTP